MGTGWRLHGLNYELKVRLSKGSIMAQCQLLMYVLPSTTTGSQDIDTPKWALFVLPNDSTDLFQIFEPTCTRMGNPP